MEDFGLRYRFSLFGNPVIRFNDEPRNHFFLHLLFKNSYNNPMQKTFLVIGSSLAGIAVVLGAFGAHALKEKLAPEQLQVFETGVRYQVYHAFALILVGLLLEKFNSPMMNYSGYFFLLGILFFSGSLYLLSARNLLGIENWKFLGPITPLGGLCFILAWLFLVLGILKK
jgi:uncharacterized membrane protein YgdD (TMEM256/DUF423 family)